MSLAKSKTLQNLKDAFAGESMANRRYLYFAQKADIEGHNDTAAVFRSTAEGETGHAHGHLEFMESVGDPVSRLAILRRLGGVEHRMFVEVSGERVMGVPTDDVERTTEDGKTSSVHFIRFPFTDEQKAKFRDPKAKILVGIDHEGYAHMAVLSPASRAELATDFS